MGTQQYIGLAAELTKSRMNSRYEDYQVTAFIKPFASTEEVLKICTNLKVDTHDKVILCVGENNDDPVTAIAELYAALKLLKHATVIAMNVTSSKHLNNNSLNTQLKLTRKKQLIDYNYSINNKSIKSVSSVRDLGIRLDSKLTFNEHIDSIVDKAYKQIGFVKRVCNDFSSINCIKALYFAYVRSVLEYANIIWSPKYAKHKHRIDSIQKLFIKFISSKDHNSFASYEDACKFYRLDTLELRRLQHDIFLLHGLWSGNIDCPDLLSKISILVPKY
ncbi:unnamed protein product [Parnassius apollo]|uniref:(apollo) hypothetical protein n=1 Tax=Parnassius apollo TaxID=110799 RepID=A0A8S3XAV4_PARAO|nr:unnamed protein product [Parnassius apollo]